MRDEMDILKEVGTTAAAHGSIALSEILGKKIILDVPSVSMVSCEEMVRKISLEGIVISLQSQILSGMEGKVIFLLEEKEIYKLIDICYYLDKEERRDIFTEMSISLIREIGGIIILAYVSALGQFLRRPIVPSLPVLINAPLEEIVRIITHSYAQKDYVMLIESTFRAEKENIQGNFWLILTAQTVKDIKEFCRRLLKKLEE
ncbi:MAG: hypothetical protein DRP76_04910 [Candidatus Omnitrophota bacterium]|nr:MAG: hypothetical protein DRP76_04910 [Candidatus Omnitrophota bacterium]